MRYLPKCSFMVSAIILLHALASAQAKEQVILYQHCNFEGWSLMLGAGDYDSEELRDLEPKFSTDSISAIRVPDNMQVIMYDNNDFTGTSLLLEETSPCLTRQGYNDRLGSVSIRISKKITRAAD